MGFLVTTADKKKILSECDRRKWFYKLYIVTVVINDTIPTYPIRKVPEKYKEALLNNSDLTMNEIDGHLKKLDL